MKLNEEITFETTAYRYTADGSFVDFDIKIKVNVLNSQIFYHVIAMNLEKRNLVCGILILKNTGAFSNEYNYTFRHEKKDYYLNINI